LRAAILTIVLDLAFGAGVADVVDVTSWKRVSKIDVIINKIN
jgi:hypothetical protein